MAENKNEYIISNLFPDKTTQEEWDEFALNINRILEAYNERKKKEAEITK